MIEPKDFGWTGGAPVSGVWRHYKGKRYLVLGLARHTETEEELVVYVPLYEHPDGGAPLQARPLVQWCEAVVLDCPPDGLTRVIQRFTYEGARR